MKQLLSITKDLLTAKQFKVNRQEMISTMPQSPYFSPSYNPFPHGGGKTSQQRELSKDMLLKLMGFTSMDKVKSSSTGATFSMHSEADLQGEKLRYLVSKFLRQILRTQENLRARTNGITNQHTSKGHVTTKELVKYTTSESSMVESRLQGGYFKNRSILQRKAQAPNDTLRTLLFNDCFKPYIGYVTDSAKLSFINFGEYDDKFLQSFITISKILIDNPLSKGIVKEYLKMFFSSFVSIISTINSSKELQIAKEQRVKDNIFFRTLGDILNVFEGVILKLIDDEAEKEIIKNGLNVAIKLYSRNNLSADDRISLNHSTSFFLSLVDSQDLNEEIKDALKNLIRIVIPVLFKKVNDEELSKEDQKSFLTNAVKLVLILYNDEVKNTSLIHFDVDRIVDSINLEDPTIGVISPELLHPLGFFFQTLAAKIKSGQSRHLKILSQCMDILKLRKFLTLPDQPNNKVNSTNIASWGVAQEEKIKRAKSKI